MFEHRIFIKRIALVAITKFFTSFRGLILLPFLTKAIGAAGYGIWSQILITVGLLTPFIMLNLTAAAIRFLPAEKDNKKVAKGIFTVIFATLFVSIFFALVLFLFSDSFANILLREPSASFFIKLTSVLLILEALSQISLESFRIFGQIKKYSILTILQTILETGLVAVLVSSDFGLFGALVALLLVRIIILSFSLHSIISHIGFAAPDFSVLRLYLTFGLPFLPMGLFDTLINSSDRYIIGFFKGAAAVGIYSATYSIGLLAVVFIFPIAYILSPTIFKFFDEGQIDKVKIYLSYSLKYFLLFSIPSVFGLTILAKTILKTLATSEFVLSNSMFIVMWVALSSIFYGAQAIYGQVIMIQKKTIFFIFAFGVGMAANLILNIIFVPYFGVLAAAVNTVIAYFIVALLIYIKSIQYIKFKVNFLFIIKSILASLIMSIAIYFVDSVGLVKILLTVIGGAAVYFVVLFLLRAFTLEEIKIFFSVFKTNNFYEKY
ncbi:MAG: multi antimicrobial extrusion protein MatE [Parcubacteria group bacterium Licking1014_1]|nr:MAG: multi antimicrobial extrusion protein MatE [Parcubacteria group bacterium Licking1014_1]